MGNTYYVDTAGSNTAPYDTWVKAATSLATVVAVPPAAGDTIYARGTETLAAEIDLGSSGALATGYIKLIGCNAGGNVDGTRFVLDGNAAGINIFDYNGKAYWWLENIEVKNTGGAGKHGFYSSVANSDHCVFINCCANTCSGTGFYNNQVMSHFHWRCVSYGNTTDGFFRGGYGWYLFCCARDNSGNGFECYGSYTNNIGCIAYDNAYGFIGLTSPGLLFNCVADSNTSYGIARTNAATNKSFIIACRITNQSGAGDIGLNLYNRALLSGYNYFENNDGDNIQNTLLHTFIPIVNGTTTSNVEDQSDTNQGYVSTTEGSEDYSTNYVSGTDPHLRRTAITIPTS